MKLLHRTKDFKERNVKLQIGGFTFKIKNTLFLMFLNVFQKVSIIKMLKQKQKSDVWAAEWTFLDTRSELKVQLWWDQVKKKNKESKTWFLILILWNTSHSVSSSFTSCIFWLKHIYMQPNICQEQLKILIGRLVVPKTNVYFTIKSFWKIKKRCADLCFWTHCVKTFYVD